MRHLIVWSSLSNKVKLQTRNKRLLGGNLTLFSFIYLALMHQNKIFITLMCQDYIRRHLSISSSTSYARVIQISNMFCMSLGMFRKFGVKNKRFEEKMGFQSLIQSNVYFWLKLLSFEQLLRSTPHLHFSNITGYVLGF